MGRKPQGLVGGSDGESANLFLIRPNFPENCMKIKKIGPKGERRVSKILLCRSANACGQIWFQFHEVFRKFSKINPGMCSFCRNFAKLCGAPCFWENVFDSFSCFDIEIVYFNFTFCGTYMLSFLLRLTISVKRAHPRSAGASLTGNLGFTTDCVTSNI